MQPTHRSNGRGPRGYTRSDARIREDVCEALIADREIDASLMRVHVVDGVVILTGRMRSRDDRRDAVYLVDGIRGVLAVEDRLEVAPDHFRARRDPELEHGIFAALLDDHARIAELFDELTCGPDRGDRAARFQALSQALLAHADAEQRVVYAALEAVPELAAEVRKARVEHSLVEHLMAEIDSLVDTSPEWMTRVEVLEELVQQHAQGEETRFLPRALAAVDPRMSEDLAARFARARDEHLGKSNQSAPARPRPRGKASTTAETSRTSSADDSGRAARR